MASISLRNISKVYPGGVTAVSDCNLEINDKEFVVLVGPSGCGKSTTLRMIAGLEEITSGELYIGDRYVNDIQPKDRDIAMVFQNYALYPHMTVYKNMAFGLELRKTPKAEINTRVHEAAKILAIEHLLERTPRMLSGGERQRVALGRAMVRNPAVFLLDEPLSNLDAKLRASMRTELIKLHQRLETTFVYVTHDQIEAMTMGDRIVVLNKGFIQQVDTPQNLYDAPCNMFVAGFIGSPQMNFLDAVLNADDRGFFLSIYDDRLYIPASRSPAALKGYTGKTVKLGIRPEDINEFKPGDDAASAADTRSGAVLDVKVEVSELMGNEVYLYILYGDSQLTVRVPPTPTKAGDNIKVVLNMHKIHLFDADSEVSLLSGV